MEITEEEFEKILKKIDSVAKGRKIDEIDRKEIEANTENFETGTKIFEKKQMEKQKEERRLQYSPVRIKKPMATDSHKDLEDRALSMVIRRMIELGASKKFIEKNISKIKEKVLRELHC